MTKIEYSFPAHFLYSSMKFLESMPIFMIKNVVLILTSFGTGKTVMNTKKRFITNYINNRIIKHRQNFPFLSWIILFNTAVDIFISFEYSLRCFRSASSRFYEILIIRFVWILGIQKKFANV